ncbi:hypothetical protein AAEX28_13805 [Lentisphaerota bacterium WC36G]|nr:hypothetical protein LJT99_00555 [Lentisphaerae bacterium WC36]
MNEKKQLIEKEAKLLLEHSGEDFFKVHDLLDKQFAILQNRAQAYLSVAGIMITLSGFTGRYIAAINNISKAFIIVGLLLVFFGASYIYSKILRISWMSSSLVELNINTLTKAIVQRNNKTTALKNAAIILLAAIFCYCGALLSMLILPVK